MISSLALLLLGCGPSEPVLEFVPPPPAPKATVVVMPKASIISDKEAVGVELQFVGVGGLFQNFFSQPEIVAQLGIELAPCIAGENAVVRVAWSEEERIGHISVEGEPADLNCLPQPSSAGLNLTPMEPIGAALAHYRDAVSGKFDIRIASFKTGVRMLSGMNHCGVWTGGQYPPDGSLWKRCADISGQTVCMDGDRRDGVPALQLGDARADDYLAACFGY